MNTKLLYWNTQGFKNKGKLLEFREFIKHHDYDLIFLNENWYIWNKRPLKLTSYTLHIKNREEGKKNGGIAIYNITKLTTT